MITHLHLVVRLRMSGAIPLLPTYTFMTWIRENLSFICINDQKLLLSVAMTYSPCDYDYHLLLYAVKDMQKIMLNYRQNAQR